MLLYHIYNLTLGSNIPLPELTAAEGVPDCRFRLAQGAEPIGADRAWFHEWTFPDGKTWLLFARDGPDFVLYFPSLAEFRVIGDGSSIVCSAIGATPRPTIRHLLLDQVLPLALSQRVGGVMHASAIALPAGAVAFVGESGQGKSTLTAAFSLIGVPVLTDDCLLLQEDRGQIRALPGYPGMRLWSDVASAFFTGRTGWSEVAHYTKKKRLRLDAGRMAPANKLIPLARVYFLGAVEDEEPQTVVIARLSARETFIELLKYTFRLDITDRAKWCADFGWLGRIAELPIHFRLVIPWDLERLPLFCRQIAAELQQAQDSLTINPEPTATAIPDAQTPSPLAPG